MYRYIDMNIGIDTDIGRYTDISKKKSELSLSYTFKAFFELTCVLFKAI